MSRRRTGVRARTAENVRRDREYERFDFRLFWQSKLVKTPCRNCGYDRARPGTTHCPYCGADPR
jgi:uncharacterized OB-fold protein